MRARPGKAFSLRKRSQSRRNHGSVAFLRFRDLDHALVGIKKCDASVAPVQPPAMSCLTLAQMSGSNAPDGSPDVTGPVSTRLGLAPTGPPRHRPPRAQTFVVSMSTLASARPVAVAPRAATMRGARDGLAPRAARLDAARRSPHTPRRPSSRPRAPARSHRARVAGASASGNSTNTFSRRAAAANKPPGHPALALARAREGRAHVHGDLPRALRRVRPEQAEHHAHGRVHDSGVRVQPRAGHLGTRAEHARGHEDG